LYSHRSVYDLFQCYGRTIYEDSGKEIEKLELLLLGGDHGKGAFTFLFVIVVRYKDPTRAPMIVELQLGQIDSTEDSMELLRPSLDDMMAGLNKLMPSKEGKLAVKVTKKDYELKFGEQDGDAIPMKFYLSYWRFKVSIYDVGTQQPLTPEEIQAINMALLAEIAVEEKEEEFKSRK
jgi:hypothetical protein